VAGISFALTDLWVGYLDNLGQMIRVGIFDVVLVRPISSLLQVVAGDFAIRRLARLAQAAAVLAYAVINLHIVWSAAKLGMVLAALCSGVAIFSGVWIAGSAIAFWTTNIHEVVNSFTYGGSFLTR
jgi:ABC-2 type transport system permease protein